MTQPDRAARASGPALEAMHGFILWLIPTVEKFPRSQKFLLGDRIQSIALDVLERLIEATYTRSREGLLAQVNLGLEKLRFLFRIASELHCLDLRRYEHAARRARKNRDGTGNRNNNLGFRLASMPANARAGATTVAPGAHSGRPGPSW